MIQENICYKMCGRDCYPKLVAHPSYWSSLTVLIASDYPENYLNSFIFILKTAISPVFIFKKITSEGIRVLFIAMDLMDCLRDNETS